MDPLSISVFNVFWLLQLVTSECYTLSQDGLATEKMTKLSSVNGPFINICISSFQAVATYDLRFLHVFAGWPGRSADGSVLKHSPFVKDLTSINEQQ